MYDYSSDRNKELLILLFLLESESFITFWFFCMWIDEGFENLRKPELTHPLPQALRTLLEGVPEHTRRITIDMYDILQYAASLGSIDSLDWLKKALERYELFFVKHFRTFSDIEKDYWKEFQSKFDAGKIITVPLSFYSNLPEEVDGFFVFENKV